MAELTITTFLSLDGIMQAPGGPDEDRSGGFEHGGWLVPFFDGDMMEIMTGIFERGEAYVLGRGPMRYSPIIGPMFRTISKMRLRRN